MKKIISILLSLTLFTIIGCTGNNAAITTEEPITYQIYCSTPQSVLTNEENAQNEQIVFRSSIELNTYASTTTITSVSDADKKTLKGFTIGDETFQMELIELRENTYSTNQVQALRKYGYHEVYRTADDNVEASFLNDSDTLVSFLAYNRFGVSGSVTMEEARESADKLFVQMYGKEVLNAYDYVVETINTNHDYYQFFYHKSIHGIHTTDDLSISINKQGELCGINATTFGILDAMKLQVSSERLTSAQDALFNAISKSYTVQDKGLFVDAVNGKLYLNVLVSLEGENRHFYINVT